MGYIKAEQVLPQNIIELIQQYVEGTNIYIPRKEGARSSWGESNQTRERLSNRNNQIYQEYLSGCKMAELADKFYLSEKSIQRIVYQMKRQMGC